MSSMKAIDSKTEEALRKFLARVPADIGVERAFLYGSRARGDYKVESDADLALVLLLSAQQLGAPVRIPLGL